MHDITEKKQKLFKGIDRMKYMHALSQCNKNAVSSRKMSLIKPTYFGYLVMKEGLTLCPPRLLLLLLLLLMVYIFCSFFLFRFSLQNYFLSRRKMSCPSDDTECAV